MFLRRSFELVSFFGYWGVLIPYLYQTLKKKEIIEFDWNEPWVSLSTHAIYLTGSIVLFMIVHRIAIWIYYLIKLSDKKMALNLRNMDKIAANQIAVEPKPSIFRRIFHLKRKEVDGKSLEINMENGIKDKKPNECDTIVEIRKNKPTTKVLQNKSNNMRRVVEDIETQQGFEKRSSRLLQILNGMRRYSSNKKNNTNLILVHEPHISNITQKQLSPTPLRRAPGIPGNTPGVRTLERNFVRPPFGKASSEDSGYGYTLKRELAFSSTSISGSVDSTSLLRPSVLKKTYTNPNLVSNNPDWV